MRVRRLRRALRNLTEEASFVASDSPAAARSIVQRVPDAVVLLAEQPVLGHPGRIPGTRELVVLTTGYIVPYRVRDDVVETLRVFRSSRRPPMHC